MPKKNYNCLKCPGYCCSYPRIIVSKKDILRLAKHFNLSFGIAKRKFTKSYKYEDNDQCFHEIILRHRKDNIYKSTCQFLDPESRSCTIYKARPNVCREYPENKNCGYYEFIRFERKQQGDNSFIPTY